MTQDDVIEFNSLLDYVALLYKRDMPSEVKAIYWRALSDLSIEEVRVALDKHVKGPEGQFMPLPAHIIGMMKKSDGRPTADEAWAIVPKSEGPSVVWNDEIAEAAGIAMDLLDEGDQVAARMAFKAAYERIVERNRAEGLPVKWWLSRGHDRQDDERAVREAMDKGRLTMARAIGFCPQIGYDDQGGYPQVGLDVLKRLQ